MWFKDARTDQILFLSLFLLLGLVTRDWTLKPGIVLVTIATCLAMQWLMVWIKSQWSGVSKGNFKFQLTPALAETIHAPDLTEFGIGGLGAFPSPAALLNSLPSALITALGLSLLLRVDHYSTMMLASAVAIASKFLIQISGKHIFNPANFGIIAVLLLTQDAWVSPGQWGESGWSVLVFLATGGIVLQRVGRWDTTVAFLATYAGLEAVRNLWLGWTWDVWAHRLMSGSLLLFALFMITDPRTIPNARMGRLIWAIAIAGLTFILRNQFFISTAVLWALFALAPVTILLDALWAAPRFEWRSTEPAGKMDGDLAVPGNLAALSMHPNGERGVRESGEVLG